MSNFVVLFVCTGNICRSPMAEGILKDIILDEVESKRQIMPIEVMSAGTHTVNGSPASIHAVTIAGRHGISLKFHRSRLLTEKIVRYADLVLTMEEGHTLFINRIVPEAVNVYELMRYNRNGLRAGEMPDIKDPIGKSEEVYGAVFDQLKREIKRISPHLYKLAMEKYRAG